MQFWLILTFISITALSLSRLLQRVMLRDSKVDSYTSAYLFQFIVGFIYLVWGLKNGYDFTFVRGNEANLLLMSCLYAAGNLLLFRSFAKLEGSVVAVLFATNGIWNTIWSVIILREQPSAGDLIGVVMIALGAAVANFAHGGKLKLDKKLLLPLAAAFCFGLAFIIDATIIGQSGHLTSYLLVAFFLPGIVLFLVKPQSIIEVRKYHWDRNLLLLLVAAVLYAISTVTLFGAYQNEGPAGIIGPLSQLSVVAVVVMSIYLLNERSFKLYKLAGSVLAVLGAIVILLI